ncbi:hypothetical protein [Corallococcus carmarthensis]|uniref:hypothetical protein n=1 Tax=Corallococcus carmarthensis TaxID=2316728 RepID=UPI0011C42B1B|nr:hypothetical protein [Corallococcus carmarthensis]NOK17511.1 hypothetical protein [Corallococcus carmarthensis]
MPEKMCAAALVALRLKTLPMPVNVPVLSIVAAWHRRHEPDRAHGWLRQQVQAVLMELTAAGPR